MASRFSLVIFDLDGTLIDSAPDLCTALGLALAEFGLPPPALDQVRRMIGDGQRVLIERALQHAGAETGDKNPYTVDEVLPRFRAHYDAHLVERTVCYPSVAETLRALPQGLLQGVATNKPGGWARQIVASLGIAGTLDWVLGEDDVGKRKPDPLLVHEICRRAGVPAEGTLYVGDSVIDMATARAAGVTMALCTYGYLDPATRAALGLPATTAPAPAPSPGPTAVPLPTYLIDHFAQLLDILGHPGPGEGVLR